jgi:hypothetical protein
MGIVIQYVAAYAPWIYAICGLVALYQIYRIWLVRAERKQAVFSLEREKAIRDTYSIFGIALVLLAAMGFTYFVSTTLREAVAPLVEEALAPTPDLPFMSTPTNTPLPATPTPTWTATADPNAPTPEPIGTPSPEAEEEQVATEAEEPATATPTPVPAPLVTAPACADNRAVLIRPGQNEVVSGVVNIIGTATHDNFQYFKVEYAPGGTEGFVYLGGTNSPVVGNVLASFDTRALTNGVWTLRLTVVDQTGNWPTPCQVTITVQN